MQKDGMQDFFFPFFNFLEYYVNVLHIIFKYLLKQIRRLSDTTKETKGQGFWQNRDYTIVCRKSNTYKRLYSLV